MLGLNLYSHSGTNLHLHNLSLFSVFLIYKCKSLYLYINIYCRHQSSFSSLWFLNVHVALLRLVLLLIPELSQQLKVVLGWPTVAVVTSLHHQCLNGSLSPLPPSFLPLSASFIYIFWFSTPACGAARSEGGEAFVRDGITCSPRRQCPLSLPGFNYFTRVFFSLFLLLKPERETWSQSDPRAEVYCSTAAQKPQNVHVEMMKFAHLLLLFRKPQRDSLV